MLVHKKEKVEQDVVVAIICDVCKKKYNYEDDAMEVQEFLHICFQGGYGSIFGDGANIKCDICQHCVKEKLGKFLNYLDIKEG